MIPRRDSITSIRLKNCTRCFEWIGIGRVKSTILPTALLTTKNKFIMTNIYLPNGSVVKSKATTYYGIRKAICDATGTDICEKITDEIECYSLDEDEQELVNEHKDCDFYQTFHDVFGAWQQPEGIVAVEEY